MTGIEETSWRLPEGHERVAVFATQPEAVEDARARVHADSGQHFYYLSNKRGAWEVIRASRLA